MTEKYKGRSRRGLDKNVGTGLPDGPRSCTELPLRGRTVKDAGPYILLWPIMNSPNMVLVESSCCCSGT